jgi:hypothetical protein
MEIPLWWLVVSGLFFFINCLFFLVLMFVVIKLVQLMTEMKPKIESLEGSIQSLVVKVGGIAENVEELTATVKTTVDKVGGNAVSVASNAQIVAQAASTQFERYSPLVVGAIGVIRVIGALRASRQAAKEGVPATAKSKASSLLGTALTVASHFLKK